MKPRNHTSFVFTHLIRCKFHLHIFRCYCNEGWTGVRCGKSTSPCFTDPCLGDCRCVLSCRHSNGYQCVSEGGYIGRNCSIRKLLCSLKYHHFEYLHSLASCIFSCSHRFLPQWCNGNNDFEAFLRWVWRRCEKQLHLYLPIAEQLG